MLMIGILILLAFWWWTARTPTKTFSIKQITWSPPTSLQVTLASQIDRELYLGKTAIIQSFVPATPASADQQTLIIALTGYPFVIPQSPQGSIQAGMSSPSALYRTRCRIFRLKPSSRRRPQGMSAPSASTSSRPGGMRPPGVAFFEALGGVTHRSQHAMWSQSAIPQASAHVERKGPHGELPPQTPPVPAEATPAIQQTGVASCEAPDADRPTARDEETPALEEPPAPQKDNVNQPPEIMFSLAFHERQLGGISEDYWSVATVPFQAPTYKENRMVLRAPVDQTIRECRIPSTGRLYIIGAGGTVVHTLDYAVPSVRSKIMDQVARPVATAGPQIGLVRTEELTSDEFPGYDELPSERWIQLNPSTDRYVVQIKVLKMKPVDIYRSISRGEYFVYAPTSIVLRPPVTAPAANAAAGEAAAESTIHTSATFVGAAAGSTKHGNSDINSVQNL